MLSSCRIVDLSRADGLFCGYLLAHLGAEIVLVEPPGGAPARRLEPADMWWRAYGRGRHAVTLDLAETEGRSELERLIASADVLIEDLPPAHALELGLDYPRLEQLNPALIHVSITPFGRTGPKADWPATDLTVWAGAGAHALTGDDDRAPVRTSVPQAFMHAGADAAGGVLIALYERDRSGLGQHLDVSAQQSSAQAALGANLATPNHSALNVQRMAGGLKGAMPVRMTWPAADGYVAITFLMGPAFTEPNRRLLRWVHEAGHCSAEEAEADWGAAIGEMLATGRDPGPYHAICERIEAFTRERSARSLQEEGLARGCYVAAIQDISQVMAEPHFHARGFWHDQDGVRVPGAFARLSRTPLVPPGPAPAPGGRPASALWREPPRRPQARQETRDAGLPLAGLKVLDFMWVIAGPFFTRVLADFGATVIKVESAVRMDPARASGPFRNDEMTIESGAPFQNFNAGKHSITLDPSSREGRAVIEDLVRWADVVTESFSPRAMRSWGLDYPSLARLNPGIVMLSSCLMGQTGPRAMVPGYGNMAAAMTGFYELTGWPDRSPAGPYLAYTDGVSPRFMLIALLAALRHRRETGEGQYIDLSQAEAALHLLAPALFDWQLSGRIWARAGNDDRNLFPHGVYPTAEDDGWIAVVCQSDAAWPALAGLIGADPGLASAAERRQARAAIDAAISTWTGARPARKAEAELAAAGVAAHGVQNSAEAIHDPQLQHRGHFATVPHPSHGEVVVEGTRVRFSRTPGSPRRGAPELGEHTALVLSDILGYDDVRIAEVLSAGALEE